MVSSNNLTSVQEPRQAEEWPKLEEGIMHVASAPRVCGMQCNVVYVIHLVSLKTNDWSGLNTAKRGGETRSGGGGRGGRAVGVEVAATGGGCAVAEGPVRPPRLRTGSSRAPRAPETAPKPYVEQTFTTGFRGRRSVRAAQSCVRSESPFRSQHQNSHSSAWPRLGPCKPQREHRTLTCLSPHARTHARCTHMHAHARTAFGKQTGQG